MLPPDVCSEIRAPPPPMVPRRWLPAAICVELSGKADVTPPPLDSASIDACVFSGSNRVMLPPEVLRLMP